MIRRRSGQEIREVIYELWSGDEDEGIVSVVMIAGEMWVEVHDNGCGLGPAAENLYEFASREKFWILGMKEQAQHQPPLRSNQTEVVT